MQTAIPIKEHSNPAERRKEISDMVFNDLMRANGVPELPM